MDTVLQDLRYAFRALRNAPGFTIVALVALALGIGANTAVFSIVNAVLLRPLPYGEPNRAVMLWNDHDEGLFHISERERLMYGAETAVFRELAGFVFGAATLTGEGDAARLRSAAVNAEIFRVLAVSPKVGRSFTVEEDAPGRSAVAILSHELWQRRFGADPDILGRTITVNRNPRVVVGVLPPGFRLPLDFTGPATELFVPLALDPTPDPRNLHYMNVVARLQPRVDLARARAHIRSVAARVKEEIGTLPESYTATLRPVREEIVGDVKPALLILLGAVGFVLLIACANVANLLLARAETRTREIAVRTALGAGRGRLVRQMITESVVLALLGGGLGLAIAVWGTETLVALSPPNLPRVDEIGLDGRVLAFTAVISLLTGMLFGLVPAFRRTKDGLREALTEGGRGSSVGGRNRARRALVTAEVALAGTLAIGAGLMIRSFVRLKGVDSGFRPDQVLTFRLSLPFREYPSQEATRDFYGSLLERLRALPGVEAAGAVTHVPLASDPGDWSIHIDGRPDVRNGDRRPYADWMVATDGYFETMRMPLLQGRTFERQDVATAAAVVVINERMARDYWPEQSPIGARLMMTTDIDTIWRTVVGVVGDVRHHGLDTEPNRQMFLPHSQFPYSAPWTIDAMTVTLRTRGAPLTLAGTVRREVQAIDPDVPVALLRTMDDVVATSTSVRRLYVLLFGAFAAVALMLVTVGVYGVTSYLVTTRTRELGIRIALGAAARDIFVLVLKDGMALVLAGLAIGLGAALVLTRLLERLLFGVGATDPATFAAVGLTIAGVALLANYVPARRAVRVDPMATLKSE